MASNVRAEQLGWRDGASGQGRRRFIRRALTAALALPLAGTALAACGQTAAPANRPTREPTPRTQRTPTTDGKIHVEFLHGFQPGGTAGDTMAKLVQRFNVSQNAIAIESVGVPAASIPNRLEGALRVGPMPDLVWGNLPVSAIEDGLVVPLEDYFAGGKAFDIGRFDKSWLDLLRYKEKVWALPFELSAVSVGINKDAFDKAGIAVPKFGWTWDQMLDIAKKLTKPGERWGWANTRAAWQWWDPIKSTGGALLTTGTPTRAAVDSPAAIRGASTYADLWLKHKVTTASAPYDELNRTGLYAMWPTCFALPSYGASLPFKYAATTYPTIDAKASQWCYKVISLYKSTPERQEAAFTFLQWFYQDDTFLEWSIASGTLPLTKAQQEHPLWKQRVSADPAWEAPLYQIQNGYLFVVPAVPTVENYYSVWQAAVDQMIEGKASPSVALGTAAKEINRLIDKGHCLGCKR